MHVYSVSAGIAAGAIQKAYVAITQLSHERPTDMASTQYSGVSVRACSSRPNAICQLVEQLCQPRLVRITGRAVAIGFDPFRVLSAQIVVNLLFEFGVSIDFVRYRS